MTLPVIRPEDVPRMPSLTIRRLRARLAEECAAAAVRHAEILAAREAKEAREAALAERRRRLAAAVDVEPDPDAAEHAASIDVDLPNPEDVVRSMQVRTRRQTERRRAARVTAPLRPAAAVEGRAS